MDYENKPCAGCGAHFHKGDDIVVCPICATPQHRSCWNENGKCVNEAKHAEGYVWSAEGTAGTFEQATPKHEENQNGVKICPICGSENPEGTMHCGACGALLEDNSYKEEKSGHCNNCGLDNEPGAPFCHRCGAPLNPIPFGNMGYNPFGAGFEDQNEKIGEHTVGELSLYVRTNVSKFLDKFRKIENGKNGSFNWAAFIFGPFWYFYRKMYKVGTIFIVTLAAIALIAAGTANEFTQIYSTYMPKFSEDMTTEERDALYDEYIEKLNSIDQRPIYVFCGLLLVTHFLCGLLAYKLYYKKILDDFNLVSSEVEDKHMQAMLLSRRGGVSVLNMICGYFFYQLVVNLFTYIASYVSQYM